MLAQVHHQAATASSPKGLAARFLALLLATDARFREREQLRQMTPECLSDIGLTSRDVDRAIGGAEAQPHDPRLGW